MSAQTVSTCVVCGSETDAFLCGGTKPETGCLGKLQRKLGNCAALQEELDVVLSRQNKTGGQGIGYVTRGADEHPLPVNLKSTEAVARLRDTMCLWIRDLHETHTPRLVDGSIPPVDVELGIVPLSRWLMRHPTWIALHPAADDLYEELTEAMSQAWHTANFMAPDTVFYGICGNVENDEECTAHLYGRADAWTVVCKVCTTEHEDLEERKEQLDWAMEDQYVPMGDLVGLITGKGKRVTSSMVRGLALRGRIVSWVRILDGDVGASVEDWYGNRVRLRTPEDADLQALYRVGDVLDVITERQDTPERQVA
ncbi:hypothetical protein C8D88_116115 [Lentzea atacamensis]|uniref:Uncharacterized protein n=1 Tax=Lentzea atacamensis TaxID=531938 RepID=A0A316HN12_9PSEU|nr:hypothetical protein [Lentzea atacamensis]PWK81704.1 hypothetical protein C8D88_116115 [Lentzea atacamensis]